MTSLSELHSQSSAVASKRFSYAAMAHLFAAPAFLLLIATVVAPIFVVVLISLTDYRLGRLTLNFVGLGNYVRMINDPFFWAALRNSAIYTAIVVPVSVFGALCVAVLLDGRRRSRRFYEIVYFLPVTSTLTAMSIVWSYLLNGHIGPLASLLDALGLPALDFFADGTLALIGLAIIGIWHLFGFNLILFLAGLTVISSELNEASALDGMDGFCDRLRYLTWPLLAPTTIVVVVLSCIQSFQVFDTVAVLTNGGPYGATEMLLHKINTDTFTGLRAGYGSALTVVYLLLIGTFSIVHVGLSNRKAHF
ncbi:MULTISPECIES: carbohydrate ABC transporter permease [Rhizobium/Agrobacterium group]|uniref:carbohydrate ABC transporter permease n=1 Tax=Rhizobium/Agrobacterium group TaxID=227290 RepID=UPI000B3F73A3|nr:MULTISPECIES: sugar ABC transporter permease [Rhizobium/Agrobacterium group]MCF1485182.1 sugar ABC transporter permease [Allorhizobium ampelinum]NSZ46065.1 sugar ABC transporter permease [Agrobacterium vitis]NTA29813.1 sugar ABC transporter permease [Allorhizobium ampelinum]OVE87833.1 ABC transporter permease [Allorhizobium ampelinum]